MESTRISTVDTKEQGSSFKSPTRWNRFKGLLKEVFQQVVSTSCRFPSTMIILVAIVFLIIYRIHSMDLLSGGTELVLDRIMGVLSLGIPVSLAVQMSIERIERLHTRAGRWVLHVFVFILIFLYFQFMLPNMEWIPLLRLVMLAAFFGLFFLAIPYMFKRENFEVYIARIITRLITSAFFALVLALGFSAILLAVKTLLYDAMDAIIFSYPWILSWILFLPVHFLYFLPPFDEEVDIISYSKILRVLVMYIVLPIISIYTIILYLYFVRLLINKELPVVMVSYLVVFYSAIGIGALFMIKPFAGSNKWAGLFTKWFTRLIYPLLVMMFAAIVIRISNYGFTENRYFVLLIGLWVLFAVIYLLINKVRNTTVLLVSLAVVVMISVVGPFNAHAVSKWSQNARLETILRRNVMIDNGHIIPKDDSINEIDKVEITGILDYFNDKHDLNDVWHLPKDFEFGEFQKVFGFLPEYSKKPGLEDSGYFYYMRNEHIPLDIRGYDFFLRLNLYSQTGLGQALYRQELMEPYNDIVVEVGEHFNLTVQSESVLMLSYDLREHLRQMYDKHGSNRRDENSLDREMLLELSGEGVVVVMYINNLHGYVSHDRSANLNNLEMDILIKIIE